jgi:alkylation response protein AidB-like acyl-CoA dehydrogenase
MDVRLSAEQEALRDAAARLVERLGPKAVGDLDDAGRSGKLDDAIAAAGWRELRAAGDGGGPLASGVEAALVAAELARGLADAPFVGPTLAAELRRAAGAGAAAGPEAVALDATLGAFGTAVAVDAAGAAGAVGVRGRAVVALDVGAEAEPVDLTRRCAAVAPGGEVVGELAGDALTRATALGLALACADLVGVMRGAVALACDHARQRHQYGVPIGSFQAVQHMLADAHVLAEGSWSITLHAAWAVDALEPAAALAAAAAAKAYCARAARTVCETAIQVHGGLGNTWDCLAHVFLRRALLDTEVLGGVGPSLALVLAHNGIGPAPAA